MEVLVGFEDLEEAEKDLAQESHSGSNFRSMLFVLHQSRLPRLRGPMLLQRTPLTFCAEGERCALEQHWATESWES